MDEPVSKSLRDEIRTNARRVMVSIRLLPSGIDLLENTAHKHSRPGARITRSDVLRHCMVIAYRHETELDKLLEQQQNGEI